MNSLKRAANEKGAARSPLFRGAGALVLLVLACAPLPAQNLSPTFDIRNRRVDLLYKLNNPLSGLAVLPYENNVGVGPAPGYLVTYTLNVRPSVPISMGKRWRLVTQAVLPFEYKEQTSGSGLYGLSDTEVSLLLSQKKIGRILWGAGSVWLMPSATTSALGSHKWSTGPAFTIVRQNRGWTVGASGNHAWSFVGSGATDVSKTSVWPWISYSWEDGVSLKVESDSRYDWKAKQWTTPLGFGLSKLYMDGKQPINFGGNVLYYVARSSDEPSWGVRFSVNFVLSR